VTSHENSGDPGISSAVNRSTFLFQSIALIGEGQSRTRIVQCLGRGPRDRSFVRHAENDSLFVRQHIRKGSFYSLGFEITTQLLVEGIAAFLLLRHPRSAGLDDMYLCVDGGVYSHFKAFTPEDF
jgi:hypothetical protein